MSHLPPRPGLRANLGRLLRLTRKELSESLRDRRTILTLVLMPLLLYPVLAMAFLQMMQYKRVEKEWPKFYVGVAGEEVDGKLDLSREAKSILSYWAIGQQHRQERHTPPGKEMDAKSPPAYLEHVPVVEPVPVRDVEAAVRDGVVDVGVRLKPPGPFDANPGRLMFIDSEVFYRQDSTRSHDAVRHLELLTADANAWQIGRGLRLIGIKQRGDPVRVQAVALEVPASQGSSLAPVLVPLVLILMTMTGAVYPAIDLTAGERERGTLEILVAAPIPRLSVLLAKYAAVFTVAMLTALVNLGSMALTLQATGLGPQLFGASLSVAALAQVLSLLLLFASFFSAVLLTLTSFARSFKEAQAYLIPLMLLCLAPGVLALLPGLSLRGVLAVVPLVNIVLLARDVFAGTANPLLAGMVVLSTLLYALAAIALATRVFGTEAVLTSETSSIGDLFRRPDQPRTAADPAGALLVLALLFPAYFLVTMSLGQLWALDLGTRLLLASGVYVLLFVAVPLVASWLGRVELIPSLRLRRAGWLPTGVAVLLGASLWPFVHEALLYLRQAGWVTLPEEVAKGSGDLLRQARELSPLVLVMCMAVVPAVTEELFFRGYLLSALLGGGERPARGIVGSAALFALFHLFVGGAIALERLPSSFALGLILGWLAYTSGSIVPGMILHVLHNGVVLLLGYYEPRLVEAGWLLEGQEHLPAWLLATAAAMAAAGLAGAAVLRPPLRTR
jgi:ABC-2 type transport system permease protein/sodium transport system permease protein